jgi:hypothetical protein
LQTGSANATIFGVFGFWILDFGTLHSLFTINFLYFFSTMLGCVQNPSSLLFRQLCIVSYIGQANFKNFVRKM